MFGEGAPSELKARPDWLNDGNRSTTAEKAMAEKPSTLFYNEGDFRMSKNFLRAIKWQLQRLKDWRYANIHFALGRWAIWGRGELLLQRVYWRGMWTPFLRTKARYEEGAGERS
jgi:hypothetical protein